MILGDFSDLALSVRVVCPSFAHLTRALPLFDRIPDASEVDAFRERDWSLHGQEILWASTFFHEFHHLLQTTTLTAFMHRTLALHRIGAAGWDSLQAARARGLWPPSLPARSWLRSVAPDLSSSLEQSLVMHDLAASVRVGDPRAVRDVIETPAPYQPWVLKPPPTLSELDDSLPLDLAQRLLTPQLIRESETTLLETRFLAYWFGLTGVQIQEMVSGGFSRPDYDVVPFIAARHGMAAIFPLLVDWAFQMPTMMPLHGEIQTPPERLVALYREARPRFAGMGVWDLVARHAEVVGTLGEVLGISPPSIALADALDFLERYAEDPWRKAFVQNIHFRLQRPEAFIALECFYQVVFQNSLVPQLIVTGDPSTNWHGVAHLDERERRTIMDQAIATFDVLESLLGDEVFCPFCEGQVNVGAQPGPLFGRGTGSGRCHCGWRVQFENRWGLDPSSLTRFSANNGRGDACNGE